MRRCSLFKKKKKKTMLFEINIELAINNFPISNYCITTLNLLLIFLKEYINPYLKSNRPARNFFDFWFFFKTIKQLSMELATNWLTELQPTGLLHKRESYQARVQGDMRPVRRGKQNIFTNLLK